MTSANRFNIAAVLAAGGRGLRFAAASAADVPKQFINLAGRPIYMWSLLTLLADPDISRVLVVVPPDMVHCLEEQLSTLPDLEQYAKPVSVIAGGDTRQLSVFKALEALEAVAPDFVLVHDAARPFLSTVALNRFIEALVEHGSVSAGIPVSDTIKRIEAGIIVETVPREPLWLVQTPQGAHYEWLMKAHKLAESRGMVTTDDAALLESAGHAVHIAGGSSLNLKITRADDLILAEALATILFKDRL